MQSGWRHEWITPQQLKNVNIQAIIPGHSFDRPKLLKASPYVTSCPSTITEREELTRKLKIGIPDPWAEYLAFRGAHNKRSRNNLQNEYQMRCANLKITKAIWQEFGVPMDQGIPDPTRNVPLTEKDQTREEHEESGEDHTEIGKKIQSESKLPDEIIKIDETPENVHRKAEKMQNYHSKRHVTTSRHVKNNRTQTEREIIHVNRNFSINPIKCITPIMSRTEQNQLYSSKRIDNGYYVTLQKNPSVKSRITRRLKRVLKKFIGNTEEIHECQCKEFHENYIMNLMCSHCNSSYLQISNNTKCPCYRENSFEKWNKNNGNNYGNSRIKGAQQLSKSRRVKKSKKQVDQTSSSVSTILSDIDEKQSNVDVHKNSTRVQLFRDSVQASYRKPGIASQRLKNHIDDIYQRKIREVEEISDVSLKIKQKMSLMYDDNYTTVTNNTRDIKTLKYNETDDDDATSIGEISYDTEILIPKFLSNKGNSDYLHFNQEYNLQDDKMNFKRIFEPQSIQRLMNPLKKSNCGVTSDDSYHSMSPPRN